jgi:hypothetical protein
VPSRVREASICSITALRDRPCPPGPSCILNRTKRLHHPLVGDLDLTYEAMQLTADAGQTLLVYAAEPASPTSDALQLLASAPLTAAGLAGTTTGDAGAASGLVNSSAAPSALPPWSPTSRVLVEAAR